VLVALAVALLPGRPPAPTASAQPVTTARAAPPAGVEGGRAAVPARRAASLVVPEAPVSARLPSGRVVGIRPVSTRPDGSLDVPDDIGSSGWWRGGARVGDPFGSMLVAAHLDSRSQGLGPYAELLTVQRGQTVRITTEHLHQDFVVRSRQLVRQGPLAEEPWLFSPAGSNRLTLVTCAPPFDRSRGGYQSLAVVTAVPATDPIRRSLR
jgi:hypothetical protein